MFLGELIGYFWSDDYTRGSHLCLRRSPNRASVFLLFPNESLTLTLLHRCFTMTSTYLVILIMYVERWPGSVLLSLMDLGKSHVNEGRCIRRNRVVSNLYSKEGAYYKVKYWCSWHHCFFTLTRALSLLSTSLSTYSYPLIIKLQK